MRRLVLVLAILVVASCGGGDDDAIWQPTPTDRWHIQYSGELEVPDGVDVVDLDMEETSERVISELQDDGIEVVCYLSAGSWEPYRDDAADFPDALLGEAYIGFEDERWLDIRASELRPLLTARIGVAEEKGCDAVDPDNVDGYQNETGFDLTAEDQLEFNRWLFAEVHDHGMAVGLKNDRDQVDELVDEVEFHVDEECLQDDDCHALSAFVDAGKPIWSIEYEGEPSIVCPRAAAHRFATWIKTPDLDASGHECPLP